MLNIKYVQMEKISKYWKISLTLIGPGGGIKTQLIQRLVILSVIELGVSNLHVIFILGV